MARVLFGVGVASVAEQRWSVAQGARRENRAHWRPKPRQGRQRAFEKSAAAARPDAWLAVPTVDAVGYVLSPLRRLD